MNNINPWRFCTAPMMEWSDRNCRYFWRLLSRNTRLYTEMINIGAILRGDRQRFLPFSPDEAPLALQVGGSNPQQLAECARIAEDWGYDEINLNCGCPSDRVQEGRIGACLMGEPQLVADCVAAMRQACGIHVTVKHRIGIDFIDSEEDLHRFVGLSAQAGCEVFIVHARKAWLQGLSPKQNREIPPLDYQRVFNLKQAFPHLTIVLNGGITSLEQSAQLLAGGVDGVMMGREAYHNPYVLAQVDQLLFGSTQATKSREQVFAEFIAYTEDQITKGVRLHHLSRHILGLFLGQPGGRVFRRFLSENGTDKSADADTLRLAYAAMQASAAQVAQASSCAD